jgi:glutathione S-transferase
MPPKITLHHLVHSRANRIFWCLEELGLKYAVKVHYRGVEGRAPASLKALSRLGKVSRAT